MIILEQLQGFLIRKDFVQSDRTILSYLKSLYTDPILVLSGMFFA